jgi:hypothetical protein
VDHHAVAWGEFFKKGLGASSHLCTQTSARRQLSVGASWRLACIKNLPFGANVKKSVVFFLLFSLLFPFF